MINQKPQALEMSAASVTNGRRKHVEIDLTQIDTVFLSHGHYDHAGGMLSFAAVNP